LVKSQAITRRRTRKTEEIETLNLSDMIRSGSVFAMYHKKNQETIYIYIYIYIYKFC